MFPLLEVKVKNWVRFAKMRMRNTLSQRLSFPLGAGPTATSARIKLPDGGLSFSTGHGARKSGELGGSFALASQVFWNSDQLVIRIGPANPTPTASDSRARD
jgi:hypothetical protein